MDDDAPHTHHVPILVDEILSFFPRREAPSLFLDATAGGGGHSAALLAADSQRIVVALDRDELALERASHRLREFGSRALLLQAEFGELGTLDGRIREALGLESDRRAKLAFDGALADLGISSDQLDDAERGFSLRKEGPLDMRMDRTQSLTAEHVVNTYDAGALAGVLQRGGLRAGLRGLVSEILQRRPFRTTTELAAVCSDVLGRNKLRAERGTGGAHPATVPFQAIRMEVNDELGNIERFLVAARERLAPGARLAVLTFHSLEDELVTRTMRAWGRAEPGKRGLPAGPLFGTVLTRDAICASSEEIERNSRARSARLRVFERAPMGAA